MSACEIWLRARFPPHRMNRKRKQSSITARKGRPLTPPLFLSPLPSLRARFPPLPLRTVEGSEGQGQMQKCQIFCANSKGKTGLVFLQKLSFQKQIPCERGPSSHNNCFLALFGETPLPVVLARFSSASSKPVNYLVPTFVTACVFKNNIKERQCRGLSPK